MRSHFEIACTDAEQPWVVRFHADNGLEVWRTSENYADRGDAERALCILAEALYLGRAQLVDVAPVAPKQARVANIRLDLGEGNRTNTATLSIPVLYVDERRRCVVCGCSQNQACDPPCHWVAENLCSSPACVVEAGVA
jgi:uncharacterized protein YegP (UPF0339 family)